MPIFDEIIYINYYPYGKTLRQFVTGDGEKFLSTQHERDQETGLDYRGARFYDSDVARFLSLDPLASKFPNWSDYVYVVGNPLSYTDPDGKDTLVMHRSKAIQDFNDFDEGAVVFEISFSLIEDGQEKMLDKQMYMLGSAFAMEYGENSLPNEFYPLKWDQMSFHRGQEGYENTIRVTSFGVFLHPGNYWYDFAGCYAISCNEPELIIEGNDPTVFLSDSRGGLTTLRNIYNEANGGEDGNNFTGSKFLLRTNSSASEREFVNKIELKEVKPIPTNYDYEISEN